MELYTKRTCIHTLEMTERDLANLRVIINYAIDHTPTAPFTPEVDFINIAKKLEQRLLLAQNKG